jgi:hypothetical protein
MLTVCSERVVRHVHPFDPQPVLASLKDKQVLANRTAVLTGIKCLRGGV